MCRQWCVILALLGYVLSTGCASHVDRLRLVRAAHFAGDEALAAKRIDELLKKPGREADVLKLDKATILLGQGRAKEAESLFRDVRDRFDQLEQKSLAGGVATYLTDDRAIGYAGEDYEKILLRVFLALSNLLEDGQDAGAYALQVAAKQQEIIDRGVALDGKNPKANYKKVAAGAYLHALLREATHIHYDDAERSLQLVSYWAPEFAPAKQDLERARQGRHSAPGNGVLYLFALVGAGPYKEDVLEIPSTVSLLVADRILSAVGKHTLPPTVAPIRVPKVVAPYCDVQAVQVILDGKPSGRTETLTDINKLAIEQGAANFPYVMGRAIARRAVKKAVVYGTKEALGASKTREGALGEIALDVVGVAWEAAEVADTRCWGLLPAKIQVLRVELPAGKHDLALQPITGNAAFRGQLAAVSIEIQNGRNTYVLANIPARRLAGGILASRIQ